MLPTNNTYCIIDSNDLESMDFSQLEDTSADTVRYNLERTKFIIEYSGPKPDFVLVSTEYTHAEIKALILDFEQGWEEDTI